MKHTPAQALASIQRHRRKPQTPTRRADPTVFEGQEPGYQRYMPVLESFPKPIVAAVNGVGVGIGLTMLLHCDIVLMSDQARLKVPFISLGVTTEASASLLMPATMGWQRAAEVLFTEGQSVKKGQKIAVRVVSQFGEESTKVVEV